jgi:hypothetical protein
LYLIQPQKFHSYLKFRCFHSFQNFLLDPVLHSFHSFPKNRQVLARHPVLVALVAPVVQYFLEALELLVDLGYLEVPGCRSFRSFQWYRSFRLIQHYPVVPVDLEVQYFLVVRPVR